MICVITLKRERIKANLRQPNRRISGKEQPPMKKMLAALLAAIMTLCFAAALAEDTGHEDLKAKGT